MVQTLTSLAAIRWLSACGQDAFDSEMRDWLLELDALSLDIKETRTPQSDWHAAVEEMLSRFELSEVFELIDFEQIRKDTTLPDNGAAKTKIDFSHIPGAPADLAFVHQVFAMDSGRAVVPHGHNNMVSAFLVLEGKFTGRHYDRVEDQEDHIIITPTIDDAFGPGGITTLSDDQDNVHWFRADEGPGYLFNVHVRDVVPDSELSTGRVYLDPNGEDIGNGMIRAPRISYADAHALYG
jgi:hypothetical protein